MTNNERIEGRGRKGWTGDQSKMESDGIRRTEVWASPPPASRPVMLPPALPVDPCMCTFWAILIKIDDETNREKGWHRKQKRSMLGDRLTGAGRWGRSQSPPTINRPAPIFQSSTPSDTKRHKMPLLFSSEKERKQRACAATVGSWLACLCSDTYHS